jgi:hypothetical protein
MLHAHTYTQGHTYTYKHIIAKYRMLSTHQILLEKVQADMRMEPQFPHVQTEGLPFHSFREHVFLPRKEWQNNLGWRDRCMKPFENKFNKVKQPLFNSNDRGSFFFQKNNCSKYIYQIFHQKLKDKLTTPNLKYMKMQGGFQSDLHI